MQVEELLEEASTLVEWMFHAELGHPILEEVRVTPLRQVDSLIERKNARFSGRAIARSRNG